MRRLAACLVLALSLGCQAMPVAPTAKPMRQRAPAEKRVPTAPALDAALRPVTGADAVRAVTLVGKVKLLSDKGLGVISNNSGGLISNNGGGLISDKGMGVVSGNGGSYRVQATAPRESLLAEAHVEVLDAEGRVLTGADGEPIGATTDAEGGYRLEAALPVENLVLRVRLFPGAKGAGGELSALLPTKEVAPGEVALDLDTASSLSAAYVLDQYVKGSLAVYDRLPAAEAAALDAEMEAARGAWEEQAPSYRRADLVQAAEQLRGKAPALDKKLEEIEAILLIGQKELGQGLPATHVSLVSPSAIAPGPDGGLVIAEGFAGRLRRIDASGRVAGLLTERPFLELLDVLREPDGSYLVLDSGGSRLYRVSPTGEVASLFGTGLPATQPDRGAGTQVPLSFPLSVMRAADGTIYVGEGGRLMRLGADGQAEPVPPPPTEHFDTFGLGPDGTIYTQDWSARAMWRRTPAGSWERGATGGPRVHDILVEPDGTLIVSESDDHRVEAIAPDGTRRTIAGNGEAGYAGDGGPAVQARLSAPAGLWRAPDGTLYVADKGNAVVRAIAPDGTIRTVAGAVGLSQAGDVKTLSLNGPAGLTLDPQGRVVIAESGTGLIKRLDGDTLTVIAGTTLGFSGDGGPATEAKLNTPVGVAYHEGALHVLSTNPLRLRRVGTDGIISSLLGPLPDQPAPAMEGAGPWPADAVAFDGLGGLVIDPAGRPVFSATKDHVVVRYVDATRVELAAGTLKAPGAAGDGGAATAAGLTAPMSVAYDPAGNLYVSDAGNMVIRRVAPDGAIATLAGIRPTEALLALASYKPGADEGRPAKGALIFGPGPLAFDGAGNLYVAEFGTERLTALGGLEGSEMIAQLLPKVKPRLRKITPDGRIFTVAGPGSQLLAGEGSDDTLGFPTGMVVDAQGRLVVSDGAYNQIKIIPAESLR